MMCSSKVSKHALQQIGQTSSIGNKGIVSWYLRMVRYSIEDICWPIPSICITKRKSWTCNDCEQPKIAFYLVIMSNFTSMFWALLLKGELAKTCYDVLASKTAKVKIWNRNTKIIQSSVEINVHTIYPIVSQYMIL